MFSNQGPAQEDHRARWSRRNMSKGAGGQPFLRDGPLVPYGPPTLDLWGTHRCCVAWRGVATHRREPRPRKPCGRPNDAISPTRESLGRLGTDFASRLLPSGLLPVWLEYQTLLIRAKMPAVATCGPFACPPPAGSPVPRACPPGRGVPKGAHHSVKRGCPWTGQGFTTNSAGAPR